MKKSFFNLILSILFGPTISCGASFEAVNTDSLRTLNAKHGKTVVTYNDASAQKKWVYTSLAQKKPSATEPHLWRPTNNLLASIYQNVLDAAQISPVAVYNAFRYFEDHRGHVQKTEVCQRKRLTPKEFGASKDKIIVLDKFPDGDFKVKICWDIQHQIREDAMAIADYANIKAETERMIIVDLRKDKENITHFIRVAHGTHSGKRGELTTDFGNVDNSSKSSQGYYLGYTEYDGGNGHSLRLIGLNHTNSEAFFRYIVVHGADYAAWGGRSNGCPAVEPQYNLPLIEALTDGRPKVKDWFHKDPADYISTGGLLYIYDGQQVYKDGSMAVASL